MCRPVDWALLGLLVLLIAGLPVSESNAQTSATAVAGDATATAATDTAAADPVARRGVTVDTPGVRVAVPYFYQPLVAVKVRIPKSHYVVQPIRVYAIPVKITPYRHFYATPVRDRLHGRYRTTVEPVLYPSRR